jgi:hypothetical protein
MLPFIIFRKFYLRFVDMPHSILDFGTNWMTRPFIVMIHFQRHEMDEVVVRARSIGHDRFLGV